MTTASLLVALVALALTLTLTVASPSGAQSPELSIEKSTNGHDADTAPGPTLTAGDPVSWAYEIAVVGPSTMYDVIVTDSSGVIPRCDVNNDGNVEDSNIHPGPLKAGQSFFCTATGTVHPEGTFASVANAQGSSFDGTMTYAAQDASHYTVPTVFRINPDMTIQTMVNGEDANTTPGPLLQEGSAVTWSYVVTNTGNVPLTDIEVTNSLGVPVDCGDGTATIAGPIAPGGTSTCTSTGPAPAAGSGIQQGIGQAFGAALDPETAVPVAQANAEDSAAYTPVELPKRLAFTGPSDHLPSIALVLFAVGGLLHLGAARRRGAPLGGPDPES